VRLVTLWGLVLFGCGTVEREGDSEGCDEGLVECGTARDPDCRNLDLDPTSCGTCSTVCAGDEWCESGSCACRPGLTRCGDQCVDTYADPLHCGTCPNGCNADQSCVGGGCSVGCGDSLTACDRSCVDLETDPLHCGDCNISCQSDAICVAGACRVFAAAGTCQACPCSACDGELSECCFYPQSGRPICGGEDGCP